MRAIIASSIGAACAVALALPLSTPTASAAAVPPPPGSTQSLPLVPLTSSEPSGSLLSSERPGSPGADRAGPAGDAPAYGLPAREVEPFSLLGAVWEDPDDELHGRIEVRTRAADTGDWSAWHELEVHADHGSDASSVEHHDDSAGHRHDDHDEGARGSTSPVWVGDSDGVQVRVLPESGSEPLVRLPEGLRLELVDPGDAPAGRDAGRSSEQDVLSGTAGLWLPPIGVGVGVVATRSPGGATSGGLAVDAAGRSVVRTDGVLAADARADAPRPPIVTRKGWGADESLREPEFLYSDTVRMAFVHHTAMTNDYTCEEAPSVIRAIYRYHVKSNGWRDVGYNFFVDKCGTVYEGRAGGVDRPVMGAHTGGFNGDTTGIALLGTYSDVRPPKAAVDAIAAVTAWKLGLHDVDAQGSTVMTSGGSNKYGKGTRVELRTVSGHSDAFVTECPGGRLYDELDAIREKAALLQTG